MKFRINEAEPAEIAMADLKHGQTGVVIGPGYKNVLVMCTKSGTDTWLVFGIEPNGDFVYWDEPRANTLRVRVLPAGTKIELEV